MRLHHLLLVLFFVVLSAGSDHLPDSGVPSDTAGSTWNPESSSSIMRLLYLLFLLLICLIQTISGLDEEFQLMHEAQVVVSAKMSLGGQK
ncbi:hypothetical protein JEQ12_013114 [Ovis aries]|uniref:Uncharacterized protein n=1 Tax=Ovis aries TaxID=9940 RepID=A0A835ZLZ7_SHEEP|nr:hypothetical protein JEQ12_013114 [Ovis aries]